jgi:hypothetical protein
MPEVRSKFGGMGDFLLEFRKEIRRGSCLEGKPSQVWCRTARFPA